MRERKKEGAQTFTKLGTSEGKVRTVPRTRTVGWKKKELEGEEFERFTDRSVETN